MKNTRKWIALLLFTSLAISVLMTGCGKKKEAVSETAVEETAAAETAAAETKAAEAPAAETEAAEETTVEETEPVPVDVDLSNDLFTITMDSSFDGLYEVEYDDEHHGIDLYDKKCKDAGYGGFAFGISAYENPADHAQSPCSIKCGELTDKDGVIYDIVLSHPSDVQYDPEDEPESFIKLYEAGDEIVKGLKAADGGTFVLYGGTKGEDLYPEVLAKHVKAISEGWSADKLEKAGMSPMYYAMSLTGDGDVLDRIGYAYMDMNNDGIDELMIGEITDDENLKGIVYDLYTMADREPVHVVSGWARNRFFVSGRSMLANEYSNGAAESGWLFYDVEANTGKMYPQIAFKYDEAADSGTWFIAYGSQTDEWESVDEDEWNEMLGRFTEYDRFDYAPLSGFEVPETVSIKEAAEAEDDDYTGPVRVEAVYLGAGAQSFADENGNEKLLDSVMIYLSDGSFEQYTIMNNDCTPYSSGYYLLAEDGRFTPDTDGVSSGGITMEFNKAYDADEGLAEVFETEETALDSLFAAGYQYIGGHDENKDIAQIYLGSQKQPYTNAKGVDLMLDTVWVYYTDGSFEQYAIIKDRVELFSAGTYELGEGAGFKLFDEPEANSTITINRNYKYVEGSGLQDYESSHTYQLGALGFDSLYTREVLPAIVKDGVSVTAVFAGAEGQPYVGLGTGTEYLDTFWVCYSDDSFEQYAQLKDGFGLYACGDYILDDNGTVVFNIRRELNAEGGFEDMEYGYAFDSADPAFAMIVSPEDAKKDVVSIFADEFREEYTNAEGLSTMLDTVWTYYADGSFTEYAYLDGYVVPYSCGTYSVSEGGDFHLWDGKADAGILKLDYEMKADQDGALEAAEDVKCLDLNAFGYDQIFDKNGFEPPVIIVEEVPEEEEAVVLEEAETEVEEETEAIVEETEEADKAEETEAAEAAAEEQKEEEASEAEETEAIVPDSAEETDEAETAAEESEIIDFGDSKEFTKSDLEAAAENIMNEFDTWEGCEMHKLSYAGDEAFSLENLDWLNEIAKEDGKDEAYTECICFLSDFHSPKKASGAWEKDKEYEDWQWWLARAEGGEWELVTWGY
ncbi:MAG: hypothetical protein II482_00890 [Lachnospiraceae bacterium]|nr:hypothetical protein [Lachnospiraceae bacterium]